MNDWHARIHKLPQFIQRIRLRNTYGGCFIRLVRFEGRSMAVNDKAVTVNSDCPACLNHRYLFWVEERQGLSGTVYTVPLVRACDACNRDCQLPPPVFVRDSHGDGDIRLSDAATPPTSDNLL